MCKDRYDSATLILRAISTLAAGALLCALIALPTGARGATFDEKVSAPRALSSAELQAKARDYFAAFAIGSASMLDVTRDPAKHSQLSDLRWQLHSTIDQGRSLGELADYGIKHRDDGSFSVDLERFPQWDHLHRKMKTFLDAASLDTTMPALKQRGFRDSDIESLREYLKAHDPDLALIAETKPLMESFARRTQKRAAAGQRLTIDEMMAFNYQTTRIAEDVYRRWAVGVLDSLDQQRQRILVSYLTEGKARMSISPDSREAREANLNYLEDFLLSGKYVQATEEQVRAIQERREKAESRQ